MIFVTVGTQLPFDRLIRTVDEWAGASGRAGVFAQIGPTALRPAHIEWTPFLEPPDFKARFEQASVVVAHAGMGSIIAAMQTGKPILVMPRRESLREHRNDHQFATAVRFRDQGRVSVALDEAELRARLDQIESVGAPAPTGAAASPQLIERVRAFIEADHGRERKTRR